MVEIEKKALMQVLGIKTYNKKRESGRRSSIWPLVLDTKNTPLGSRM